jgi:hypothetical protein
MRRRNFIAGLASTTAAWPLAAPRGIARFGPLSPDARVRHGGPTGDTGDYDSHQVQEMAFRLASLAAKRDRSSSLSWRPDKHRRARHFECSSARSVTSRADQKDAGRRAERMCRPHRLTGLFDANAPLTVLATCNGLARCQPRAGPLLAMERCGRPSLSA